MRLSARKLLSLVALGGLSGAAVLGGTTAFRSETPPAVAVDPMRLQSGDLIFRRGRSTESRVVLALDRDAAYSHVGILHVDEGRLTVIHAVPGQPGGPPLPVQVEPLTRFISGEYAIAATVRRLRSDLPARVAQIAARTAMEYARDSVIFDSAFRLDTEAEMYCTELVWRAYGAAGLDLVDGIFDSIRAPLVSGEYLLPSSLLDSPHLEEVHLTGSLMGDDHEADR